MDRCPRCGNDTEQLRPMPLEAQVGGNHGADKTEACQWCVHEILEG